LRVFSDQFIDLREPVAGHAKQVIGESADFFFHIRPLRPKRLPDKLRRLFAHVSLKEHLQSQFTGFSSSAHGSDQPSAISRQENFAVDESDNSLQDSCIQRSAISHQENQPLYRTPCIAESY
jgi:hypothetical protein